MPLQYVSNREGLADPQGLDLEEAPIPVAFLALAVVPHVEEGKPFEARGAMSDFLGVHNSLQHDGCGLVAVLPKPADRLREDVQAPRLMDAVLDR